MQDVGHAIVEAYSRVLVGVAFSILSRVAEIMLEDDLIKKPNSFLLQSSRRQRRPHLPWGVFQDVSGSGIRLSRMCRPQKLV